MINNQINQVVQGKTVKIKVYFYNDSDALYNPTTVTFKIKPEATGTTTSYVYGTDASATRISTGIYQLAYDTTSQAGLINWRVVATDTTYPNAEQGQIYVIPKNTA